MGSIRGGTRAVLNSWVVVPCILKNCGVAQFQWWPELGTPQRQLSARILECPVRRNRLVIAGSGNDSMKECGARQRARLPN